MSSSRHYDKPSISDIGTLQDLTLSNGGGCPAGPWNKIGRSVDCYTAETGGNVIGSLVRPK